MGPIITRDQLLRERVGTKVARNLLTRGAEEGFPRRLAFLLCGAGSLARGFSTGHAGRGSSVPLGLAAAV